MNRQKVESPKIRQNEEAEPLRLLITINVKTPIVAGVYKDHVPYRIFVKYDIPFVIYKHKIWESLDELKKASEIMDDEDFKIKLLESIAEIEKLKEEVKNAKDMTPFYRKSQEIYEKIKKLLEKDKFKLLDYIFMRKDPTTIDISAVLLRPLHMVIKKQAGIVVRINEIQYPSNKYIIIGEYISTSNTIVFREAIPSGEKIYAMGELVLAESDVKFPLTFEANIVRGKNYGYGRVEITIVPISTQKA